VQLYDGDGNPVGVATDAKLEAARVLLASLDDKDYATQAKQDDATAVLDAISTAVATAATEATLAQIKTALTDGTLKAQLSGSLVEKASAQHTEVATTVKTYTRAAGASRMDVFVESGRVRIRTDGEPCTAITGEPLGEGFGAAWTAPSISVLFVDDAVITVVSR
jgi:hypothetical protein